jgi:hypothetical protein
MVSFRIPHRSYAGRINWRSTPEGNVEVLNGTAPYYRYFDATAHAAFLYCCIAQTVDDDLPHEVAYLQAFAEFSKRVQHVLDMPERNVDLLHRFLRSGNGLLSKRAREREFASLTDDEAARLEAIYTECFA